MFADTSGGTTSRKRSYVGPHHMNHVSERRPLGYTNFVHETCWRHGKGNLLHLSQFTCVSDIIVQVCHTSFSVSPQLPCIRHATPQNCTVHLTGTNNISSTVPICPGSTSLNTSHTMGRTRIPVLQGGFPSRTSDNP